MSGVTHVVDRARADDPHTLAVVALAGAMLGRDPSAVLALRGARNVDGVQPLVQLSADASTLVYHQNGGAPALVSRLAERGGRIAVVINAVATNPMAVRDLQVLAASGATALATTGAAARQLTDLGFARVSRVPPVVARDRLVAVGAFEPTKHHLEVALHGPLVLTVDDVATAVSAARVVQAYHVLRTYLTRAGHLAVGVARSGETDEAAVRSLFRETWGLRLTDAWVNRLRNRGERAALTRHAAVFVTADPAVGDVRHALAAMAEGVAVVAPANDDAAEILGADALLLPAAAGACLIGEAVAEVLGDQALRARLSEAARRAVERFDPARVAPMWHEALAS
jgi:glycosyltransferase involved in cell wall biosynthesis